MPSRFSLNDKENELVSAFLCGEVSLEDVRTRKEYQNKLKALVAWLILRYTPVVPGRSVMIVQADRITGESASSLMARVYPHRDTDNALQGAIRASAQYSMHETASRRETCYVNILGSTYVTKLLPPHGQNVPPGIAKAIRELSRSSE